MRALILVGLLLIAAAGARAASLSADNRPGLPAALAGAVVTCAPTMHPEHHRRYPGWLLIEVTDEDGRGVPHAALTFHAADPAVQERASTAVDGCATVFTLPAGRIRVDVDAHGFRGPTTSQATVSERAGSLLRIRLSRGLRVSGHVVDDTGAPLVASISLLPRGKVADGQPPLTYGARLTTRSDKSGAFAIDGADAADYVLVGEAHGVRSAPVHLRAPVTDVAVVVPRPARWTVRGAAADPLVLVRAVCLDQAAAPPCVDTQAEPAHTVHAGTALAPGRRQFVFSGPRVRCVELDVPPGGDVTVDVPRFDDGVRVRARAPGPGAHLALVPRAGPAACAPPLPQVVGVDGAVTLSHVPPGAYRLVGSYRDAPLEPVDVDVVNADVDAGALAMAPAGIVVGRAAREDGSPSPYDIAILAAPLDPGRALTEYGRVAPDGAIELPLLLPGSWLLTFRVVWPGVRYLDAGEPQKVVVVAGRRVSVKHVVRH